MSLSASLDSAIRAGVHTAYLASLWPAWQRYAAGARDPEATQRERLRAILTNNESSEYGKKHRFSTIVTPEQFQDRVPIVDYDEMEPWILRAAGGESGVLTSEEIRLFEVSGGSSSANKLIPYTAGLLSEFSAATHAWLFDLYSTRPGLVGTQAYWSISPVSRQQRRTQGGIPIGIEDDTEYFGPLGRWALGKLMAVPSSLARVTDMEEWRLQTMVHLLACRSLGLISVWHPSFLTLLVGFLEEHRDEVLSRLDPSRRDEVAAAFSRGGRFSPSLAWPELGLVSCWTDGSSCDFIPHLKGWFSGIEIQGKGLLATEGVVTIPITVARQGCPVAVAGHFIEFLDLECPEARPLLVHELNVGGHYSPILTTSGGTYRYHLKDEVECVGMWMKTPCLRFVGKLDATSDLRGEKITPAQVDCALAKAKSELRCEWNFAMLAPVQSEPPHYVLYVESTLKPQQLDQLRDSVENSLSAGHHYSYCRKLGQLGPLSLRTVSCAVAKWQDALTTEGLRAGALKPMSLDTRCDWEKVFAK